jgi:hypothetical protein
MMLRWFAACVAAGTPGALGAVAAGIPTFARELGEAAEGQEEKAPQHAGIDARRVRCRQGDGGTGPYGNCSEG